MSQANERIVRILRQAGVFYFSSVDGEDKPNVRPFNAVMDYDDKVYFYTNNHKNVFKQISENPCVEICASISEDRWIRIRGEVVFDYHPEVRQAMLDANPKLKKIYNANDKIFEVFYLTNVQAKIHSLHDGPEIVC